MAQGLTRQGGRQSVQNKRRNSLAIIPIYALARILLSERYSQPLVGKGNYDEEPPRYRVLQRLHHSPVYCSNLSPRAPARQEIARLSARYHCPRTSHERRESPKGPRLWICAIHRHNGQPRHCRRLVRVAFGGLCTAHRICRHTIQGCRWRRQCGYLSRQD